MKGNETGRLRENPAQAMKLVVAVGLSLVAAWLLCRPFANPDFKAQKKAFASLGEFAAEEFFKLVPGGRVQTIYDVPDQAAGRDNRSANRIKLKSVQASAFKKHLSTLGKYSFAPDVRLSRGALAMNSEWPTGMFQKLLDTPDTTLVLFSSLPTLDSSQQQLIHYRTRKIVVVGMTLPEVKAAVQSRIVQLAISNRIPAPPGPPGEETPEAWARRVYAVLTPESAETLR